MYDAICRSITSLLLYFLVYTVHKQAAEVSKWWNIACTFVKQSFATLKSEQPQCTLCQYDTKYMYTRFHKLTRSLSYCNIYLLNAFSYSFYVCRFECQSTEAIFTNAKCMCIFVRCNISQKHTETYKWLNGFYNILYCYMNWNNPVTTSLLRKNKETPIFHLYCSHCHRDKCEWIFNRVRLLFHSAICICDSEQ